MFLRGYVDKSIRKINNLGPPKIYTLAENDIIKYTL